MSEKRIVQQRGLYFDELEEGVIYRHQPGRTVSDGWIVAPPSSSHSRKRPSSSVHCSLPASLPTWQSASPAAKRGQHCRHCR